MTRSWCCRTSAMRMTPLQEIVAIRRGLCRTTALRQHYGGVERVGRGGSIPPPRPSPARGEEEFKGSAAGHLYFPPPLEGGGSGRGGSGARWLKKIQPSSST